MAPFAACVASAGSDATHDRCLVDVATGKKASFILKHTPEALAAWATAWRTRVAGQPMAVWLEPSRGPLLSALRKDAFWVLYPIHPPTLAKARDAFSPSRAQDAPRDADELRERLVQHRDRLKAWRPEHAKTRTLQSRVEYRRRLVHDRTRLSPRLMALVPADFPPLFPWFDDLRTRRVGDGLLRWPTGEALTKVRPATLETFFHEQHSVRRATLSPRIAAIKAAIPWTTKQAVMHASVRLSNAVAPQMKTTIEAIRGFDHELEQRGRTPADDPLLASRSGAGTVYAARLTAAMGTVRDRWTTGDELRCFSGGAPVLERSGKSTWSRWRYGCPTSRRQSCHESAGEAIHHCFWAQAYDRSPRARGKRHQAAVRALAFQWIRSISKCWQTRTPDRAVRSLESLRKKGSPLLAVAAHHPS